jgi:hypothetical protein
MTNMPHTRTILIIVGIGSLFILGSSAAMAFVAGTSQLSETKSFQWNWRHGQELSAEQSLRKAKVTEERRKAIAGAISDQIRPMKADLGIESETDLLKAALDTRVKLIDLSADGVREVVAQGMVNCGATGNCPLIASLSLFHLPNSAAAVNGWRRCPHIRFTRAAALNSSL